MRDVSTIDYDGHYASYDSYYGDADDCYDYLGRSDVGCEMEWEEKVID